MRDLLAIYLYCVAAMLIVVGAITPLMLAVIFNNLFFLFGYILYPIVIAFSLFLVDTGHYLREWI